MVLHKPMYIYSKHIVKTILPVLFVITVVLTSLVWVVQVLNLVNLLDKGIELKTFIKLVVLLVPYLLFMIMPIISVIAVIYIYNRLQDERQLIILRGAGLNNYEIAKPALFVAMIVTIITTYISAYLMPVSYTNLKKNISNVKETYVSNLIETRTFNQISKYATIYVDSKNQNDEMYGIILFDNKIPENKTVFFAKKGEIVNPDQQNPKFLLSQGLRHSYDTQGNITTLHFDHLVIELSSELQDDSERNKTSMELFIPEMLWPDTSIPIEKQNRLITDGHLRLVWPLYNFVFVFLALAIFLSIPYARKTQIKPFIYTFVPVLAASYFHFTLQKMAYKDLDYIFLCYGNAFICIIFSIWQTTRRTL
ncbi:MAG: LptF/LptG family permease [Rickettsiaceae bacterium]|jgi:lipopolysaccharide export system permease protein|nr:LptF/LptG family permease [Rickettsiaceae bacterium]